MATPTVRTIATDAYREIGAIGIGDAMPPAEAELGLLRFQNQVDAWQADRLTISTPSVQVAYTIPSNTNTVTVGPGGTVNIATPVWFTDINYVVPGSTPEVETPMGEMDATNFALLSIKNLASQLPTLYYYERTFPLATLFFWPKVTQNVKIYLYVPTGPGVPATLDSVVQGPPGYQEAFMYQLALRLQAVMGLPMPATLAQAASTAYARIKRPNLIPAVLGVDQALIPTSGSGGAYNVLNDTTSSPSNR